MKSSSKAIKVIPGIHDLQGREHMGQGLLFGQITIQRKQDLCQRRPIGLHIARTIQLITQ